MLMVRSFYENIGFYSLKNINELRDFNYLIMSDLINYLKEYKWKDEFEK